MTQVNFAINKEDEKKVDFLKPFAKTTTRTKVFLFCLRKTYEFYKADKK